MKTDLSSFNNKWYYSGKPMIIRILWYITNVLCFINPLFASSSIKIGILKLFCAQIGKGVVIKPSVNIKYPWKLKIGNFSWIGERVWIDNLDYIEIGNNCCVSQGAMLLCGNHNYKVESFDLIVGSIILKDGVWIGAHSVVCPGVTCESHSILTVMSVANKNLESYSIYSGNPAQFIRTREITKQANKINES